MINFFDDDFDFDDLEFNEEDCSDDYAADNLEADDDQDFSNPEDENDDFEISAAEFMFGLMVFGQAHDENLDNQEQRKKKKTEK